MAAHVPRVAAARRYGRRIRHVLLVVAGRGHLTTRRHVHQVRAAILAPRPSLPERRQRAHDQPRVQPLQVLVPQAEGRQVARHVGLQNDVRGRRKVTHDAATLLRLDVQRNAPLGGVVVPEVKAAIGVRRVLIERPNPALRRAAGRLHLDHVGAVVSHQLAAPLPYHVGQLQHAKVPQGTGRVSRVLHGLPPPMR